MEFNGRKFKDSDTLAGYEIGFKQGRRRVGRRLYDRPAPEHFDEKRRLRWEDGYRDGLHDRKYYKKTLFSFKSWNENPKNGSDYKYEVVSYSGHRYDVGEVLVFLQRKYRAAGDVEVTYYKGGEVVKTVIAGI